MIYVSENDVYLKDNLVYHILAFNSIGNIRSIALQALCDL